jgi:hypothetical protein
MSDGKSLNIQIMKLSIMFSRIYKTAGTLLAFLLISVIINGQDYNYSPPVQDKMSSLKRLVLGIDGTQNDHQNEMKILKNIDFETYVKREILIEKWMHDKNLWMHGTNDLNETTPIEDWMYKNGAWKLIDSDLGMLQKPEPDPKIELAEWMYAEEFIQENTNFSNTSHLERWMSDRSYWIVKK